MSRLRRLVVSNRFFFITCRMLPHRGRLSEEEFELLARVVRERRQKYHYLLLPGKWFQAPFAGAVVERKREKRKRYLTPFHSQQEVEKIRHAIKKSKPYGSEEWVSATVAQFGLENTLRNRGRPGKGT